MWLCSFLVPTEKIHVAKKSLWTEVPRQGMDHITDGDEISSTANILPETDHKDDYELWNGGKNQSAAYHKHIKNPAITNKGTEKY
jgi:hypothetical protein